MARQLRTRIYPAVVFALSLGALAPAPARSQDASRQERLQAIARLLHERITACWNAPIQKGARAETVKLQLAFNSDGSLAQAPTLLNPKPDPTFKALAESTLRAVNRCAPYPELTRYPELYARWRLVTLNFQRPKPD